MALPKIVRLLRYEWPLFVAQSLCSVLPDNVVFLRLRGYLCHFFLGSCGRDFRCGRHVVFSNPANVHLGDRVYIAYGCWLQAAATITLEDEVMLGPYCVLAPANHTRLEQSFRYGPLKAAPILIKKGAWLGAQVVVLKGACIGAGTVVAANTTVQGEVPDGVAFGNLQQAVVLKSTTQ